MSSPTDKASYNVIKHDRYFNIQTQELISTNANTLTFSLESNIVSAHTSQITKFIIKVEPKQS